MIILSKNGKFLSDADEFDIFFEVKTNKTGIDRKLPHEVLNNILENIFSRVFKKNAVEQILEDIGLDLRLKIYDDYLRHEYDYDAKAIRDYDKKKNNNRNDFEYEVILGRHLIQRASEPRPEPTIEEPVVASSGTEEFQRNIVTWAQVASDFSGNLSLQVDNGRRLEFTPEQLVQEASRILNIENNNGLHRVVYDAEVVDNNTSGDSA